MITLAKGARIISKRAGNIWTIIDIDDDGVVIERDNRVRKVLFSKFNKSWEVYKDPEH